jgi:outer membrane protein
VGNFPGQSGYEITQGVVGLQLNLPLFSGGGQAAKVDEAIALREKIRQDLVSVQRATHLAGKQAWYGWQIAQMRRAAGLQAAKSALSALRVAEVGIAAGVKTEVDRLNARQQLESARRDFNKARYDGIVATVKLKAAAGRLTDGDLAHLEPMFLRQEDDVHELVPTD